MKAKCKILYQSGNYDRTKSKTHGVFLLKFTYEFCQPVYVFRELTSNEPRITRLPESLTNDTIVNATSDDIAIREAIKLHDNLLT